MYGYIKPLRSELRVRENEHYKAAYCGLCHELKRKYGIISRFLINYDFTLLSIVLSAMDFKGCSYDGKRCIVSPFKKKCVCTKSKAGEFTADATVILSYWKIKDNIADKSFFKGLLYRAARLAIKRPYNKARKSLEWFDCAVRNSIEELQVLEKEKTPKIDAAADTFAKLLSALSDYFEDEKQKRIAKELFYHIGRVIYIIDALFDMEEDKKSGNYNPILLSDTSEEEVIATINCSLNAAIADWSLVKENELTDLVLNVLTMGVPSVVAQKGEKK